MLNCNRNQFSFILLFYSHILYTYKYFFYFTLFCSGSLVFRPVAVHWPTTDDPKLLTRALRNGLPQLPAWAPPRMHFAIVSRLSSNQHKSTGLPHESHPSSLTPRKTVYPNAKTETRFNCRECRRISSIYYGMCTLNTVYKSCLYITLGFSWILIVYKTGSNCLCSHAGPTFLWDWHGIGLVKIEIRLELGFTFLLWKDTENDRYDKCMTNEIS